MAKAGVDALAVQCAIELGPRGITSNIIAPGPVAGTEGVDRLYKDSTGAASARASKAVPSGRLGTVKDIADATVFLFSDAANWVNGATLVGQYPNRQINTIANLSQLTEERGECQAQLPHIISRIRTSSFLMMPPLVEGPKSWHSYRRSWTSCFGVFL